MSRFIEEIPEQYLEGIQQIQNSSKEEDEYQSPYTWGYKNMNTYKIDTNKKQEIENVVNKNKPNTYNFRTPESFLKSITNKSNEEQVDLSKYKAGIRIYHKKFGEGTINYVEREGNDLKVDITFDKVGHKRLMAKFAKLEII